jgi:hypothetical protein
MGLLDFLRGTPTEAQYAEMLINSIRNSGETRELVYHPDESKVSVRDDAKRFLWLGNIYREYCQAHRSQRPRALAMQVQSWFASENSLPSDFTDAAGNLLPRVRERAFWPLTQLTMRLEGLERAAYCSRPLTEHLVVSVVYDWPSSMCEVGEETFKEWDVTLDYALEQATRNLAGMSEGDFLEIAPGVLAAPWDDSYQSSRLVLADRVASLRLKGQPVATVPVRNELLICGSDDPDGIAALAALTEECFEKDSRAMSAIPVWLEEGTWVPFLPPADHPAHNAVKMLWIKSQMRDYEEQKHLLDRLHEKEGTDIWVASFSGVKQDDGNLFSYSVLTKTVDTLLPVTDRVALLRDPDAEDSTMVAWDRLVAVAGDVLEPTDLYPTRYRVKDFPTDEQYEQLKNNAEA